MLSVKNVMAGRDDIGTLIFDEVDTGVSGRAAQKIGHKLRQVAADRQVIVVTHLAQVAAYAQHHLLISKTARDDRTFTSIIPLEGEDGCGSSRASPAAKPSAKSALEHAREVRGRRTGPSGRGLYFVLLHAILVKIRPADGNKEILTRGKIDDSI